MTEMIVKTKAMPGRHMIDPLAFFGALILAPVVVTLLTFWILLVPVFALVLGGPLYLITGVPVLLWWLGRREPRGAEIALLSVVTNLVACGLIFVVGHVRGAEGAMQMAAMFAIYGSVFAPFWGAMFARLYMRMRRPFFTRIV